MGRHAARSTCPFCGWYCTDMRLLSGTRGVYTARYAVRCCSCKAIGPPHRTREGAAKLWNAQQPIRLDRHGEAPDLDVQELLHG